jgi:hypothetical protein
MDTAQRRLGDPIRGGNGAEAHQTGHFHGGRAQPTVDDGEGSGKGSLAGLVGSVRSSELGRRLLRWWRSASVVGGGAQRGGGLSR